MKKKLYFYSFNKIDSNSLKKDMIHYNFLFRLFDYSDPSIKDISVWSAFTALIISFSNNFLGISVGLFCMLFVLMIMDYITGLSAAKLEEVRKAGQEGRPIKDIFSSKKGLGWVFKFGSYMTFLYISLLLSQYIEQVSLDFMTWFFKLVHFYILIHIFYWEIKSVDENFERIGYRLKILKIIANLLYIVSKIAERKIEKETEIEDKKENERNQ